MKLKHLLAVSLFVGVSVACAAEIDVSATPAEEILKNGDFSNGGQHWEGTGKIVRLGEDGVPIKANFGATFSQKGKSEIAAKEGIPAMEIQLSPTHITGLFQRFRLPRGVDGVEVHFVFKVSSDLKFEPQIKTPTGAMMRVMDAEWWTRRLTAGMCNIGVGFSNKYDGGFLGSSSSQLLKLGEGQTLSTWVGGVAGSPEMKTYLAFPPGTGTVWVTSVTAVRRTGSFGPKAP